MATTWPTQAGVRCDPLLSTKGIDVRTDSLAHLFDQPGPFASVLVDVSQDGEDRAGQRGLRVDEAMQALEADGAPEPVVDQLRDSLDEPPDTPVPLARLIVATEAGICLDDRVSERLDAPVATWSPLPDVAAWARLQDASLPFLLVVADREGSDVEIYRASTREPDERTTISGETEHIHKVKVGGWAQDHYQNHTEEVWRRNARQSAELIDRQVSSGIPLVVLAGDERARVEIRDALGTKAAECTVQVEAGGRAAGSSREALEAAVADVLRAEVVKRRLGWARQYQERRGRGDAVATGRQEVLDAFVIGQVETLLLDVPTSREETVQPADYRGFSLGVGISAILRLDQVLVAAAVRTAADVVVVPGRVLEGAPAAALLRWSS